MPRIDIRGSLIPNDYKWYYDWFEEDATCPKDVQKILNDITEGEELEVYINSPGGVIDVGSEIYTMLRKAGEKNDLKIYITGEACSAASVVAMAGYCEMTPTALMMVHCVSTCGCGNHNDFEHVAEMLKTADKAMCQAYVYKSGMTEDQAIQMMEQETWLTAERAKELKLVDAVMFSENETERMMNSVGFKLPTKTKMEQVKKLAAAGENRSAQYNTRMKMLKLAERKNGKNTV